MAADDDGSGVSRAWASGFCDGSICANGKVGAEALVSVAKAAAPVVISISVFMFFNASPARIQNEGGNWLSKGEDFLKKPKVGRIVKEELRRVGWQGMEL